MDLTHQQTALSGTSIDIGAALEFAKSDPDWMKKCGMHGLVMLIPIAGFLALFGWGRKIFENAKNDERILPELDIGGEISYGIPPLVAMLNPAAIILPLMIVIMGIGMAGGMISGVVGGDAGGIIGIVMMVITFGLYGVFMLLAFGLQLLTPEIQRRGYNGEMGPLFSPGSSLRAIKANPKAFVMTFIGLFVANFIGGLGVIACYVGMFLTVPFGHAMAAHILAQWDAIVQRSEAI